MIRTLLHLSACLLAGTVVRGEIALFPDPTPLASSPHYQVELKTPQGWRSIFVHFNPARIDGAGAQDQSGRSMSWTTWQTDEPMRVRVTSTDHVAEGVVIRPTRHRIVPVVTGVRQIAFTIQPGQKVSVEFAGAINESAFTGPPYGIPVIMDGLMLFADPLTDKAPLAAYSPDAVAEIAPGTHAELVRVEGLKETSAHLSTLGDAGGKAVVHFLPGVHDLGYWQVPNNVTHVHLSPGAVVYGALDVLPLGREPGALDIDLIYRDAWFKETLREAFTLSGHGVISGSKLPWHLKKDFSYHQHDHYWAHVKLLQFAAKHVTLSDVTLSDAPYWTVSFINDSDPRTSGTFDNFKIVGAWTYNNDGLPLGKGSTIRNAFVHANDDAFKLYHSNSRLENCVVWQNNNGAVFQFGWFAKSLSDVQVEDIDVIHCENWYGVQQNNRAVFNYADAGGPGLIEDVRFENIYIEGKILRLFGFKALGQQRLRDFRFQNLRVGGLGAGQIGPPGRNYFIGDISGFHFENFTLGSERVEGFTRAQFEFDRLAGKDFTFDGTRDHPAAHPLSLTSASSHSN